MTKQPILFELEEDAETPDVAQAAPVPDVLDRGETERAAMRTAAEWTARPPSRLARWFWAVVVAVLGAVVSVAAWDFVVSLLDRWPLVGWAVTVLLAVGVLLGLAMAIRELAALSRLRRVEGFRDQAVTARTGDLVAARAFGHKLSRFYEARPDLAWGRSRFAERVDEVMDADAVIDLAEQELLVPLDQRALREVEAAARQVATVTALVPLALADVFVAMVSSLRMVRHIAEIYGGRSGLLGSWRLTRAILAHLVATGAVAAGDDLLEPVLGGSVLSKLSRRFGEGVVNGALSARVGIAAMEVCRPMPFSEGRKPRAGAVIRRALTGLFSKESE